MTCKLEEKELEAVGMVLDIVTAARRRLGSVCMVRQTEHGVWCGKGPHATCMRREKWRKAFAMRPDMSWRSTTHSSLVDNDR